MHSCSHGSLSLACIVQLRIDFKKSLVHTKRYMNGKIPNSWHFLVNKLYKIVIFLAFRIMASKLKTSYVLVLGCALKICYWKTAYHMKKSCNNMCTQNTRICIRNPGSRNSFFTPIWQ